MSEPSVSHQVGALAVAALVAAVLVSFGIVLLSTPPQPAAMTVAQAASALNGATVAGLVRERMPAPSAGRPSDLLARAIAVRLGVPASRVRAGWEGVLPAGIGAPDAAQAVTVIAGHEAVVERRQGGFQLWSGTAANLAPSTQVPPFRAALRQGDAWDVVRPARPLFDPWRLRIALALLLGALLLAPLAWWIARRLTRPIRALADGAARIRLLQGDALVVQGPREVRAAAEAINAMRLRLASEMSARTRMLAAVAHDLRNPLTGLRLRAEAAPEPERGRMIADIDRMSAMIDQVLDYAKRGEATEPRRVFDLAGLARACVEDMADKGTHIFWDGADAALPVYGELDNVRRALLNLLDNAARYGGAARVSAAEDSDVASILIEDEGPGIPKDDMARVVEPFERLEPSRSRRTGGVGLGLAIARDIIARNGGELGLRNRPVGGLAVSVRLPLSSGF